MGGTRSSRMFGIALVTVALCGCASERARELAATFAKVDTAVAEALATEHIPGAVVAIGLRDGAAFLAETRAYGKISFEPGAPAMPADAIFDLASLTKPIATGTCLMTLVERGQIELDAPVARYLPDFSDGAVTVRHLMTHTSGLPPYLSMKQRGDLTESNGLPCPAATRALIRSLSPASPPGEKVVYSCLNAILCAEIVEQVTGEPLDAFAARTVFEPLGMHDTSFGVPSEKRGRTAPTTRAAWAPDGSWLCGIVHDPIAALQGGVSGNAGLFSSAEDLSRFAQFLLNGGQYRNMRILRSETIGEMIRPQSAEAANSRAGRSARGLLWELHPPATDAPAAERIFSYGHTGYTGVSMLLFPDPGAYAIVLTNRVHPDDSANVNSLRHAVWRLMCTMLASEEAGETSAESGSAPVRPER